jgi:hypothetical protein
VRKVNYIEVWVTASGEEIPLEDMTDVHLGNALRKLDVKEKDINFISLCREARRRKLKWKHQR